MKKFLGIIFVNIIFIVLILFMLDEAANCIQFYHPGYWDGFSSVRLENPLTYNDDKKSIVILGCSFAYGDAIGDSDNVSYKLQQLTDRKVYNRGQSAWGPQFVLRDIQEADFFQNKEIIEPEYFVYIFISDHIRRIYANYFSIQDYTIYDLYSIKNNKLVLKPKNVRFENYIKISTLAKRLNWLLFNLIPNDKKFDRLKLYIETMQSELKQRYPDSKFVVIVYNSKNDIESHHIQPFKTNRWDELEKDGMIVINFDSPDYEFLTEREYLASDEQHPSAKAWDVLTPIIAERLKLKE